MVLNTIFSIPTPNFNKANKKFLWFNQKETRDCRVRINMEMSMLPTYRTNQSHILHLFGSLQVTQHFYKIISFNPRSELGCEALPRWEWYRVLQKVHRKMKIFWSNNIGNPCIVFTLCTFSSAPSRSPICKDFKISFGTKLIFLSSLFSMNFLKSIHTFRKILYLV